MHRVEVRSLIIDEIGYNASCRTLEILFRGGTIYLYYFVPQDVYEGLTAADGKATYFARHIKGVYEHHRIAQPKTAEERQRKRIRKPT